MNLTTRMIRGSMKAERENESANENILMLERALHAALESCPPHYTDAECSLKLHVSKAAVRLMKELAQAL